MRSLVSGRTKGLSNKGTAEQRDSRTKGQPNKETVEQRDSRTKGQPNKGTGANYPPLPAHANEVNDVIIMLMRCLDDLIRHVVIKCNVRVIEGRVIEVIEVIECMLLLLLLLLLLHEPRDFTRSRPKALSAFF